jgi:hypothetical protein
MADDTTIPKQELLIKLLRMTESDNDPEALTALRKVNAFMRSAGWDWEKLVNSKIRIIEDPFKNLGVPTGRATHVNPTAPPRPAAPQPPPPPTAKTTWPLGITPNRFAGHCYCCGVEVHANAGLIFRPSQYHSSASSDWKVACVDCNTTAIVASHAATRRRSTNSKGKAKPFVSDLS